MVAVDGTGDAELRRLLRPRLLGRAVGAERTHGGALRHLPALGGAARARVAARRAHAAHRPRRPADRARRRGAALLARPAEARRATGGVRLGPAAAGAAVV